MQRGAFLFVHDGGILSQLETGGAVGACGSPSPAKRGEHGAVSSLFCLCPSVSAGDRPPPTPRCPPVPCVTGVLLCPRPMCLQTYIGSIIASVNPYKTIAGLYEHAAMERYSKCHLGELPPHVFAVANECYRCLWKRHDNQCVLIR